MAENDDNDHEVGGPEGVFRVHRRTKSEHGCSTGSRVAKGIVVFGSMDFARSRQETGMRDEKCAQIFEGRVLRCSSCCA